MSKVLHMANRASRVGYAGVVISDFEVRLLPVSELWTPVSIVPPFMQQVRDSIMEEGLLNPIIVVRAPREDVIRHFRAVKAGLPEGAKDALPKGLPEEEVINTIWGGSNRLDAVKQLGYTHVDCVLIPDFFTAMRVQTEQRNAYNYQELEVSNGAAGDTIK